MNISLTPDLERLIEEKVESGLYGSASELIQEAVRLLIGRDEACRTRLEELRRDIQVGLDDLEEGRSSTYDDTSLAKLVEEVQAEGRRKHERKPSNDPA